MARRSTRSALSGRGFLLFPAAAFAVHQLRYLLGYGSQADQALIAQGHGYLDSLAPWVGLLLAFAFGSFLARVAQAAAGRASGGSHRPFVGLWLLASASLVATYTVQEALEGFFASGHPGGLAGIFGHGGWWAFALATLAGLAVAALLRLASVVIEAGRRLPATRRTGHVASSLLRPEELLPGRRAPLAGASAGRAPPLVRLAAVA